MRVGSIAVGRSGDKGNILDLTLVTVTDDNYQWLASRLTEAVAQAAISRSMPGTLVLYPVPRLRALKFVITDALPGGVYATLHAGLHWQKAAIWALLDLELD